MMEHSRVWWEGELVTLSQIFTRDGKWKAKAHDPNGQEFWVALGKVEGYSDSQCLLEGIGKMPVGEGEHDVNIEAIVKVWKGQTYIIDKLIIDEEYLECVKAKDIRPGDVIWISGQALRVIKRDLGQNEASQVFTLFYRKVGAPENGILDRVAKYGTASIVRQTPIHEGEKAKAG